MNIRTKYMLALAVMATALSVTPAWAETTATGKYKIDPAHTTVLFTVSHLGFSNLVGRFNTVEGNMVLEPHGNSSVEVEIRTASIDTNHGKRDDHLRSPDFFNAKLYPVIRFTSKKVTYDEKGEPVKLAGDLTLHGVTRPVTLDVTPIGAGKDPWGGYRAGYKAYTVIKRSDYGMNFMQGGIGDDIRIDLNIEATKL